MPLIDSLRRFLHRLDERLARLDAKPAPATGTPPPIHLDEIKAFVRSLDYPTPGSRSYMEIHLDRIARTLTMVPPPGRKSAVLELGAYMHMTPALQCVLGYNHVRGAYFGPLGRSDQKTCSRGGTEIFHCQVDLFDAELDRYPYPDETFDTVLACEIFEHLLHDPIGMLLECRRVLVEGGALVLSTPNAASFTAVARMLLETDNPQIYSKYPNPQGELHETEIPHVREYTPQELREAVTSAGFEIQYLFTEPIASHNCHLWALSFLEHDHFPSALRGGQLYCVARKRSQAPITRYPAFLYDI